MAEEGFKRLEARCFCGSVHFTVDVAVNKLPLPVHLCHCSVCRYRSGAPCIFHSPLPKDRPIQYIAPSSAENIETYSPDEKLSGWQFCSTCGCHIGSLEPDGVLVAATSIFKDHGPGSFLIKKHIYSRSAKDGGIACMLPQLGTRQLEDRNPSDDRARVVEQEKEPESHGLERLRAKCSCGGVSFTIGRPTREHLSDEFTKGFVSPSDDRKWRAILDICNDCRLVNGTHVVGWTFVPLGSCEPAIGRDLLIGTAKTYSTSPGVLRSFCGTCGATIFFSCAERSPSDEKTVVDIATGILRAPGGPMAENWLTWRSRIGYLESGKSYDGDFAEGLDKGFRDWCVRKYGEAYDFQIG